jgi:hypothetical protein
MRHESHRRIRAIANGHRLCSTAPKEGTLLHSPATLGAVIPSSRLRAWDVEWIPLAQDRVQ